jgi:hypothetical protein
MSMAVGSLFDQRKRTDPYPATDDEGSYVFLNRVAGPFWQRVRDFTDEAFVEYPPRAAEDLRARFRDPSWSSHIGAWWELYLFTLFRRLGYEVEVHPDLPAVTTHPDFRCRNGASTFLVEARHVAAGLRSGSRSRIGADAWITDPLNRLSHPDFMVRVEIHERVPDRPPRDAVTKGVTDWLDCLDHGDVAGRSSSEWPTFQSKAKGWTFELTALPVKPSARGRRRRLVGIYPAITGRDNTAVALRSALKEKARKYGRPDEPFILAPLLTSAGTDTEDIVAALYGSEVVVFSPDRPGETRMTRARDGFWISGEGYRGTRVSGVLLGDAILPWSVTTRLPRLWLHPAASQPLLSDFGLPAARLDKDGTLALAEGSRDPAATFDLEPDWPGPDPHFPRDA